MRSKEQITADISATREDLGDLIYDGKDFWKSARTKKGGLERVKQTYQNISKNVQKADDAVTTSPYIAIGVTVALGVVVGLLFTRPRMK